MRFKKPFKAVPIKPDSAYLERRAAKLGSARKAKSAPQKEGKPPAAPIQSPPVTRKSKAKPVSGASAASGRNAVVPFKRPRRRISVSAKKVWPAAIVVTVSIAAGIGLGWATTDGGMNTLSRWFKDTGIVRARTPKPGDYWSRCDHARAAGSAPLLKGEPGYRPGLDSDGDGIACEHYVDWRRRW